MNLSIDLLSLAVRAIIPSSRQDHHAGIDQPANRTANGIVLVRINRRRAQTHIYNANVVRRAIGHEPIERGQNPRDAAGAGGIKHSEIYDSGIWRHATVRATGNTAVSGRYTRDVRPVSVVAGIRKTGPIL